RALGAAGEAGRGQRRAAGVLEGPLASSPVHDPVRDAWASVLDVDRIDGVQVVTRPDSSFAPPGCVALLRLDDTITATAASEQLAEIIAAVLRDVTSTQAVDPAVMRTLLPRVDDQLGPASLFYLRAPIGPPAPDVEVVALDDIEALLHSAAVEEVDESGMARTESGVSVRRDDAGRPIAACGYGR